MTHYSTLFPSKYLEVTDIDASRKTTVTIAALRPMQATMQARPLPAGFGDAPASEVEEAEIQWLMYFREFRKPIRFKPYHAKAVFAATGEADPRGWIGRQVMIYAGEKTWGDNVFPKVLISPELVMGAALPKAQQPTSPTFTGAALPPAFDTRGIGMKAADNFRAALAEQGTNTDEYIRWLKGAHQKAYEATYGKDLSDWPHGGVDLMRTFLRDYKTQHPPAGAQPQQLPEEDIPF